MINIFNKTISKFINALYNNLGGVSLCLVFFQTRLCEMCIRYFQDTQNPAASFQCIYSPSCSYSYIDSIMIQLNKLHARVLMWLSGLI